MISERDFFASYDDGLMLTGLSPIKPYIPTASPEVQQGGMLFENNLQRFSKLLPEI